MGSRIVDPHRVFVHGNSFELSSNFIYRTINGGIDGKIYAHYVIPQTVLSAFTSEVYFKCIYALENSGRLPPDRIHALNRLFSLVSPKTQGIIEEIWDDWRKNNPLRAEWIEKRIGRKFLKDLRECLDAGASAFSDYRYLYEGRQDETESRWPLGDLPGVLHETIIVLKPEWKGKSPKA